MSVVYEASLIKSRKRRTQAEMHEFATAIWQICADNRPLSARQCYYRAVVAGLIEKDVGNSRSNEQKMFHVLNQMRERANDYRAMSNQVLEGRISSMNMPWLREQLVMPFDWIADNTRVRYQADLYGSKEDAIRDMAMYYRRDLWRTQGVHVEVWCESESIAGVLGGVCDEYGVALLPCRGQSSKRFIWDSARSYERLRKKVVCLYVGDFDPAGLDIGNSVEERLELYGAANADFRRISVTPGQVAGMDLPGHGINSNTSAPALARFHEECDNWDIPRESVEAEAMPPEDLRGLLREQITALIDQQLWELEQTIEESESKSLLEMIPDDDDEEEVLNLDALNEEEL